MSVLVRIYYAIHDLVFGLFKHLDGLAPLLLRLYLAPVLIAAGLHKWHNFDDIVGWFGNTEWGLGLPQPELMATLVTATEIIGGLLLLFGLAVRWASIPLMVAMLVAALSVHWDNGWFAVAPGNPETSTAKVLADIGIPAAKDSLENSVEVGERVARAREILREHGNYEWLTEKGGFVVLNNGIEFAATYFIMLLVLFFGGGGRYVSLDYYLNRQARRLIAEARPRERMEPVTVPVSEPEPEPKPKPEPEVKAEEKPEAKPEVKPEVKPQIEAEVEAEVTPQVESGAPGEKWAAKRKAREQQAREKAMAESAPSEPESDKKPTE